MTRVNGFARSSVTLPVCAVVTTLLWWLPQGGYSLSYLLGWIACATAMFLIIELAAQNALLRVRSRMVSSLYLLLMAACGFLHALCDGSLVQLALLFSFFALLRTCERPRPEVDTLHAYLALSIGSLFWPPMLLLTLVQLFSQGAFLRSLTLRSFGAAVIGLVLPYVFWSTASLALGTADVFVAHVQSVTVPLTDLAAQVRAEVHLAQTYDWPTWSDLQTTRVVDYTHALRERHPAELAALSLIVMLGATGSFSYMANSLDDKIRVRMCHYTFIFMQLALLVWLTLQPWHFGYLFPLLLLSVVPSCAHWLTFSRSWLAKAWLILLLCALLAVALLSLWLMP